jgi:hypothetical protein
MEVKWTHQRYLMCSICFILLLRHCYYTHFLWLHACHGHEASLWSCIVSVHVVALLTPFFKNRHKFLGLCTFHPEIYSETQFLDERRETVVARELEHVSALCTAPALFCSVRTTSQPRVAPSPSPEIMHCLSSRTWSLPRNQPCLKHITAMQLKVLKYTFLIPYLHSGSTYTTVSLHFNNLGLPMLHHVIYFVWYIQHLMDI